MATTITRRKMITGSLAAGAAISTLSLPRFARAAEFNYKFGSSMAPNHPSTVRNEEAFKKIREESGGRVDIQSFPGGALGSDIDMVSQVRSGAMHFMYLPQGHLSSMDPRGALHSVPFAFKTYDDVWAAMDGDFGAYLRTIYTKVGLHAFEKASDHGFMQMTTRTKPINTPDDMKGLKVRASVVPLYVSLFRSLGASPVAIPFPELYVALQTRVVDAQTNPLQLLEIAKLYEVQSFCSLTSHTWEGYYNCANAKVWASLPPDMQAIVSKNINAATLLARDDLAKFNVTVETNLKAKGMTFNRPDREPFRVALQKAGFYKEWREKFGPEAWGVLEKYAGGLA
ncbi:MULTISPECIES: TRAP transporter substrate-binding protein [unclassified Variovorax]|uniref:TRAP transporter substrate-binding protein n=1 Tax=unclassified Variovorax TaxID=663243 RepID=UPI00210DFF99|nr:MULTISPECIES: TRAP transporter substrate-binding protein [unclassified Variovorax]